MFAENMTLKIPYNDVPPRCVVQTSRLHSVAYAYILPDLVCVVIRYDPWPFETLPQVVLAISRGRRGL